MPHKLKYLALSSRIDGVYMYVCLCVRHLKSSRNFIYNITRLCSWPDGVGLSKIKNKINETEKKIMKNSIIQTILVQLEVLEKKEKKKKKNIEHVGRHTLY